MKKPPIIDRFRQRLEQRRAKEANAARVADYAWQLSQQWNLSLEVMEPLLMIDERQALKALLARREAQQAAKRQHDRHQATERQPLAGELLRARQRGNLLRWLSQQGQSQPELKAQFDGLLSKAEWAAFAVYQRRLRTEGVLRSATQKALGCTTTEFERWLKDGRLVPDGQRFISHPHTRWNPAWLPETVTAACEQTNAWHLMDANAQCQRQPLIARQHQVHGRVTALLNRIYRLPGQKILTLATDDATRVFDIAANGEIGYAPDHKTQLRRALAEAMTEGGGLIVRRFLNLKAVVETPHGATLHPVKELCGVALSKGDWRALTKAEVRSRVLPGEANIVFADFPT